MKMFVRHTEGGYMVWCSRCSLKYSNIPSAWKPYPVIFEVRKLCAFIYYSVICDPFIYRLKSKINTHKSIVHIVVFNYRRVCLVLVITKLHGFGETCWLIIKTKFYSHFKRVVNLSSLHCFSSWFGTQDMIRRQAGYRGTASRIPD